MKKILLIAIAFNCMWLCPVFAQNNYVGGKLISANLNSFVSAAACDTIFSFPAIDTWPDGITYDGNYLFSCGNNVNYIYKHSLTGTLVDSFPSPWISIANYKGGDMDFDGTNIWLLIEESDTLYKIDPVSGNVLSKFRISTCTSNCFGVAFDGTNIWISDYSPQALYKVDQNTGAILKSMSLQTSSNMLPIKFLNNKLYGLGVFPDMLYEVDTANGSILSSAPWCLGYSLGFCRADNHLWGVSSQILAGGTQRIYQFDTLLLNNDVIETMLLDDVEISPNPSSGTVNITFNKMIQHGKIEIFDMPGKLIYSELINSESEKTIVIPDSFQGLCFLRIRDEQNLQASKIFIQRK